MSKHRPSTRAEFKELILRRLGSPVVKVNVSEDQIQDSIEEALKYFMDYHYDGSEHVYYSHTLTANNMTDRYIDIPENIVGITDVYSLNSQSYTVYAADMFSGGYQLAFEFAFQSNTGAMLTYYINKTNYEFLNQMLRGQTPIRFNRHANRLYIDWDWARAVEGTNVILDAYRKMDPDGDFGDATTDVWNDRWLADYATAKLKYIWGGNLSKFEGVQLPGGGTLNGTKIQDDAKDELQLLKDEMLLSYSLPPRDFIG